jgi:hypothetical protein
MERKSGIGIVVWVVSHK